jgi:hypothetical protein
MRFIGRALRRTVALLLFMAIRGRKAIVAAAAVLVVGYFAVMNIGRLPIPQGSLPSWLPVGGSQQSSSLQTASAPRTAAPGKLASINAEPVPAVDSYIKGLTQFDARLMWNSLSEDAINAMKSRGGSLEVLQAGLDDAKRRGARYEDITMIGNYPLADGRKYLFYVLSRRGFSGADQLEQVYFVFTVSKDGKITRIE